MSLPDIYHEFITGMQQTGAIEFIAVFAGIGSVWFSRKENILVYPVGLINTIFYIYISIKGNLLGEASVNLYYTIMSIYGWWLWSKKDSIKQKPLLHITSSTQKEWIQQLTFFAAFYLYKLLIHVLGNRKIAFIFFVAYLLCFPIQKWNFYQH